MSVFRPPKSSGQAPHIPDDLTIPQFILDYHHPIRPHRPNGVPWLVADKSGKRMDLEEVSAAQRAAKLANHEQIQTRTTGLAVSLQRRYSIIEGNSVLFFSSNHIDYPVCMWAVHRLLGVVAPCNPALTVSELAQHIKLSRASLMIVHIDFLKTAVAASQAAGLPSGRIIVMSDQDAEGPSIPDGFDSLDTLIHEGLQSGARLTEVKLKTGEGKTRIAFYSSSSGTTGPPKLVQISHYAFIANVLQVAAFNRVSDPYDDWEKLRYRPGDACLAVLPFYHIYGLVLITHFNMFAAISVVVVPKFDFLGMLKSIVRHKITSLMVVPPQVVLLCKDPVVKNFDLSSVRVVLCAAAPLSEELYDQLLQLMPQIYIGQAYGSTEATGVVSMCPVKQKCGRFGGVLVAGVEAMVVKADNTFAGYNEEGELLIKTPASATGYLDNDVATRESFVDGWIRTGDLVKIDENDEIIVVDRLKEIIKVLKNAVRGFQVAPAELEGCLLDHPYVADVCVVGVPHSYSGEVPMAFVVPTAAGAAAGAEHLTEAVTKHVAENKAPFKHLHHVTVVQSIPKTPSGKLLRRELRNLAHNLASKSAKL
ncbi:hypothetical protein CCMSSC00406_0002936 [Pleurotus cornucopiae]|uniref:Uncharacterized protein n=1 Tax=Pleurotus cornucopiae TaxID=5321 RepID=A0ACB7J7S1_PLECO|nr:hypothetical protein CCMSSC00406_0002936 [Pleurotus cornucopiae]